mmetsp:Transcript_13564/g.23162  ORF Transcript_13564/g.23162 Transcript_13564/m.23162 type:complete len:132 (+) Transcript_13564:73-468(+)
MGGGLKFEVNNHPDITRAEFFNLQSTKPTALGNAVRSIGRVSQRAVLFPLPGLSSIRLQYLFDSPSKSFAKHFFIGLTGGLVLGGVWKYIEYRVLNRTADYYKQLAIANKAEAERFRQRLIQDSKENPIEE